MKHYEPDQQYRVTSAKKFLNKHSRFYTVFFFSALILIIIFLSGYWLKSQLRFNLFKEETFSNYFPFNQLVPNKIISNHLPGILFKDSFDSFTIFGNWNPLWMKEQGKVTKSYDSKGMGSSRCLIIASSSTKSWSCTHKNYVQVNPGDTFMFSVSLKLHGDNVSAYAELAAFDDMKNAISWNYISEKIDITGKWVTVERSFTIPKGISFIMFKISGIGIGEYRFDDVIFAKK